MNKELNPCPFCGEGSTIVSKGLEHCLDGSSARHILDHWCGGDPPRAHIVMNHATKEGVVDRWNARAGEDDRCVQDAPEYGDVDGCGKCGAPWVAAEGAEAKPIGIKAKDGSEMMMVPTHFCSKDCGNWMRRG